MTAIGVILGSTRPGRNGAQVADWVVEAASSREDAQVTLVDLAEHPLPHLDEAVPAARGRYEHAHTLAWAAEVARYDGYVFVTPEYNHSTSGVLKNAIDYLYAEWANKAAGFVSYGRVGGVRAVEHLRLVLGELGVADVATQVSLSLRADFEGFTRFTPAAHHARRLHAMLDQVVAWSDALAPLRQAREESASG